MRPGMSDQRCFTSYIPNCELNNRIASNNKIQSSSQYRAFLQENAENVIDNMKNVCYTKDDQLCNFCPLGSEQVRQLDDYYKTQSLPGFDDNSFSVVPRNKK